MLFRRFKSACPSPSRNLHSANCKRGWKTDRLGFGDRRAHPGRRRVVLCADGRALGAVVAVGRAAAQGGLPARSRSAHRRLAGRASQWWRCLVLHGYDEAATKKRRGEFARLHAHEANLRVMAADRVLEHLGLRTACSRRRAGLFRRVWSRHCRATDSACSPIITGFRIWSVRRLCGPAYWASGRVSSPNRGGAGWWCCQPTESLGGAVSCASRCQPVSCASRDRAKPCWMPSIWR